MLAIFPELAAVAANQDIETLACLVRRYFGGEQTFSPKIDMQALACNVGIKISSITIEDYGAIAAKDQSGSFVVDIVLAELADGDRQERNFLIAHMLGHYFLHIQPFLLRGEWSNTGFKEEYRPLLRYQQDSYSLHQNQELMWEQEADRFAAAILLPKSLLLRAKKKLSRIETIAQFFNVSILFLERRLEEISTEKKQPRSFMEAEHFTQESESKKQLSLEPQKINPPNDPDNISRAKRSIGQSSYRKNAETSTPSQGENVPLPASKSKNPLEQSLKRFRELANRLDSSVDVK